MIPDNSPAYEDVSTVEPSGPLCPARYPAMPSLAICMRPLRHPPDYHDAMPGVKGWQWPVDPTTETALRSKP